MGRYYLHLRHGGRYNKDQTGIVVPDLEAARGEALKVLRELRDGQPGPDPTMVIEIADAVGRIVATVRSDEADNGR